MSAAAAAAAPTRPAAQQALLEATAAFVAQELQGNDGSHDFSHIQVGSLAAPASHAVHA